MKITCSWALLSIIQTDNRNILVDTGMGNKQDEKFRSFFHPHGESVIGHCKSAQSGT
ncbi:MAG: hypothetical protein U0T81_00395 [Saprospiraceae bacterium]